MKYNILTVDIQKPSNDAPFPNKHAKIPTTSGQNVQPVVCCIGVMVQNPSCAEVVNTPFNPSNPQHRNNKYVLYENDIRLIPINVLIAHCYQTFLYTFIDPMDHMDNINYYRIILCSL